MPLADDHLGATLAADDGAFQIGGPACVRPGSGQKQIRNRASLNGPPDLRAGRKGQPGVGFVFLSKSGDLTVRL